MASMQPEEFFREYVATLERIQLRGVIPTDIPEVMQLLGRLHLHTSFSPTERDELSGHLVCSTVNGMLDEYAEKDLRKTRDYLTYTYLADDRTTEAYVPTALSVDAPWLARDK